VKIERVETLLAGNWLFFLVHTTTGLTGVGEAGLWSFPTAAMAVGDYLTRYLVGKDPLSIEHHWQYVYRAAHFRGAAIQGALAAVDIALWDIAGQHLGVPIYRLLGGPTRSRVRLYIHILGDTPDALADAAQKAVADGYTAVRFDPFRAPWPRLNLRGVLRSVCERLAAVRDVVGPDIDICVECHNKFSRAEAQEVARALEPYHIFFLEDPIPPESPALMADLARLLPVTVATGERLHTLEEFRDLLAAGFAGFIRPDICLTGITQGKKIAALAEAWRVDVIPHNWLSPVNTAANLQLDASIPNLALQEYTGEDSPPKSRLLRRPLERDGGYLVVPDRPGLGIELDLDFARTLPPQPLPIISKLRPDDSVADD
jgi:galactonate dehydratase